MVAALGALYPLLRRPILTWGATSEEAASRLPGDELLEEADGVSTRAITIDAPAASVWPWAASQEPLWSQQGKIVGRRLAPFLAGLGVLEAPAELHKADVLRIETDTAALHKLLLPRA